MIESFDFESPSCGNSPLEKIEALSYEEFIGQLFSHTLPVVERTEIRPKILREHGATSSSLTTALYWSYMNRNYLSMWTPYELLFHNPFFACVPSHWVDEALEKMSEDNEYDQYNHETFGQP